MHLLHRDYSRNAMTTGRKRGFDSGMARKSVNRYVANDFKNCTFRQAEDPAQRLAVAHACATSAAVVRRRVCAVDA